VRTLNFRMRRLDDGYECIVSIGAMHIGADSDTPQGTLFAAAGLAAKLAEQMEQHPELAEFMPPQATAALKAMQLAAYVQRHGKLPPNVKRVSDSAMSAVKSILKGFI
jgi:hypothetical protein